MVIGTAFQPPLSQHTFRVLNIRGASIGTAFFVEVDERQYLISAYHVTGDKTFDLKLKSGGKWVDFPCLLLAADPKRDISVMLMPIAFKTENAPIKFSTENLAWGQPVWFLGFPYGDGSFVKLHAEGLLPMPFVKWAFVSSFSDAEDGDTLILDGHNNIGFSGGPFGFTSLTNEVQVGGMIIGYKEETQFMEGFSVEVTPDRSTYRTNSGLIYTVPANHIIDLIKSKPEGRPVAVREKPHGVNHRA